MQHHFDKTRFGNFSQIHMGVNHGHIVLDGIPQTHHLDKESVVTHMQVQEIGIQSLNGPYSIIVLVFVFVLQGLVNADFHLDCKYSHFLHPCHGKN